MEWKPNGTMRLHPFELIQQESGIQVHYRYDWHIGAMPERYTYDKTGQKQPLNELALDLIPGDYGRAVCNGRFRDWDTGIWYYALDILNVMPLTELTDVYKRQVMNTTSRTAASMISGTSAASIQTLSRS